MSDWICKKCGDEPWDKCKETVVCDCHCLCVEEGDGRSTCGAPCPVHPPKPRETISIEDVIKMLKPGDPGEFKPFVFNNEPGDMLEVYWSREAHVAEWLTPQITILRSQEDRSKIVGVHIEGVRKLLGR